jgi:hypothetical protein
LPAMGATPSELALPLTAPAREPGSVAGEETLAGPLGPRGPGGPVGPPVVGYLQTSCRRGMVDRRAKPTDSLHVASPTIQGPVADVLTGIPNSTLPQSVLKWWWLPPGTLDLRLAFPAPPRDVRRNLSSAKTLTLANDSDRPLPVLSQMDRSSFYEKRSYEESQGDTTATVTKTSDRS